MHDRYDGSQDDISTRVVEPVGNKDDIGSRLSKEKTVPVTPKLNVQRSDSELMRTYRKAKGLTTGFYMRHTDKLIAAASILSVVALIGYAAKKTDCFYLCKDEPVQRGVDEELSALYSDASTDPAVEEGDDWVNPLWEKIYGGGDEDEGGRKMQKKNKRGKKRR